MSSFEATPPLGLPALVAAFALASLSFASCHKKQVEPANAIHLQIEAKVKGLDPIQADDQYAAGEVGRAYEGLLQYHYLKRPYVLVPNLADGMPEITRDGLVYTIKIKKGVLFQDDPCFKVTDGKGRELVADDFVYSFKRLADPSLVATGWWALDGKLEGLNEWREAATKAGKADYSKDIAGLKALDRYTLPPAAPTFGRVHLRAGHALRICGAARGSGGLRDAVPEPSRGYRALPSDEL